MLHLLPLILGAVAAASAVFASPILERDPSNATAQCYPYKPFGFSGSRGKLYFYSDGDQPQPSTALTLPANATITPNNYLYLANHNISTSIGETFHFEACNLGTPLNLGTNYTETPLSDGCRYNMCQTVYANFIRIINPASGHCLTSLHYAQPKKQFTSFRFTPCEANPTTFEQFFMAQQEYTEYFDDQGTTGYAYGPVVINNVGYQWSGYETLAWNLKKDHRTPVWDDNSKFSGQDGLSVSLFDVKNGK